MALWEVNGEIIYSDGALSIPNPPKSVWAKRHYYYVEHSNVGKGGFITNSDGKKIHTPSWTEVHEHTTLDDIIVRTEPFRELFITSPDDYEPRTFASATSDKTYTVKKGKNGFYCDCWGYMAHKRCKHVKQVELEETQKEND